MKNNNSQPLVSVIIPAYNAQEYLKDAIDSILKQTYKNIEIIIIDDRSRDKTADIIRRYSKSHNNILAFYNKENMGVGWVRNFAISKANGKYIAWQDADDISLSDRIESQVNYMETTPEVGVVGGFIEIFGEGISSSVRKYAKDDKSLRNKIFQYNPVANPASMYRKTVFETVGKFNPELRVSEDLEMLFRAGEKYQFANIQQLAIRYRQNSNSLTRSKLKEMELVSIRLRLKYSKSPAYHPTVFDYIYNIAQFISIYLIPANLKVSLFNLIRNS